jgi:tyrosine aminotransferase
LTKLESLIDEKTAAIIVLNPSNPCGSVYSRKHLLDMIKIAEKHKLPIIADEVYGDMVIIILLSCFLQIFNALTLFKVFPGEEFYYVSELTQTVPVLSCNALSKRFMLPGWRFGWIAIHDPKDHIKSIHILLIYFKF